MKTNILTKDFTSGDKVLIWYDMIDFVPICEALTIK